MFPNTTRTVVVFSFLGGAVPAGNRRHQSSSKDAEYDGAQSEDLHEVLDWFKGTLSGEEAEHPKALGQNPHCPLGWVFPIGRELYISTRVFPGLTIITGAKRITVITAPLTECTGAGTG